MGKHLKIVLVANTTWNIFNFRQNIIRKILQEGHELVVLAPIDEYIEYKENFPSVVHIGLRYLARDSTNPVKDILLTEELRRKYKRLKPDLIIHYTHKPNIYGTMAARYNGIPSISIITGLGYSFIHKGMINVVTKMLYRLTSRSRNMMIFENEDDKSAFVQAHLVKEEKAIAIKGCGVNLEHFAPVPKNGQYVNQFVFTFIGRLLIDKGVREFVEAASILKKRYKNLRFIMLGDFDEQNPSTIDREELLSWVNDEVVDYKGFVRDVRPYISKSDCIVLPSYREGLPRIVLEGMAMAKPIITTNTPGCRETVDDSVNGFLVNAIDTDSLVQGMEKMLALNKTEILAMGEAGLIKARKEFDDVLIANQLYDIIFQVVDDIQP